MGVCLLTALGDVLLFVLRESLREAPDAAVEGGSWREDRNLLGLLREQRGDLGVVIVRPRNGRGTRCLRVPTEGRGRRRRRRRR